MQGLADELGVSRVTLFRRVGSREELLSRALWLLTERMLEAAVARSGRPNGPRANCTRRAPAGTSTRSSPGRRACAGCSTMSRP